MRTAVIVTVDAVLFTLVDGILQVVALTRDSDPEQGTLAVPGGYVHPDSDRDSVDAAKRILLRKTGIVAPYLEQLSTFASADRDPRGWSVSIAYYALVPESTLTAAGAEQFELVPVDKLPRLAFDHNKIVTAAVERVRNKSSYSSLPCYLLPEQFTQAELQLTYEQVLGEKLDKSSFRRKLDALGFLEPIEGSFKVGVHRPAQLYRLAPQQKLALFNRVL
jgi:8-oxo-dGTP diphosphatase